MGKKFQEIKKAQKGVKTSLSFSAIIRFTRTKSYTAYGAKLLVRNDFLTVYQATIVLCDFFPKHDLQLEKCPDEKGVFPLQNHKEKFCLNSVSIITFWQDMEKGYCLSA